MSSEKPNFWSQPVVKNIFMYRNGDPYYEARRIVINQRRVCNFETLLHEVTSGIQAPFGAVRNIYTPRGGHKVDCLDGLQSGEQYVAAGRERFKKLDYLQICSRKKRMLQAFPLPVKPLPPNRIIVSARFLKPIKEPCSIFVVANGDVLNPAMRLLIHQRMLSQFDRVLELVTEKMGLRVLGGVRSLYTYEGQQVTDGNQLESGQLYVAVGREKFKKLPYIDLLFTRPRGMRRMKAYSLPPIYRMSKQNGTGKSMVQSSDSGDGDSKASPPAPDGNSKEHLSSIVREISQARLISLRKRRSGQNMSLGTPDNDDMDGKTEEKSTEDDAFENPPEEETSAADNTDTANECSDGAADKNETTSEVDASTSNGGNKGPSETKNETMGADEQRENEQPSSEQENSTSDMVNGEADERGTGEESKSEGQEPSDKTQDSNEKDDKASKGEQDDQDQTVEAVEDSDSGKEVNSREAGANDADTGEDQKEHKEHNNDPDKTQADNETKDDAKSKSSDANGEEDGTETKETTKKSGEVNGEVSGEDDEVMSEVELKTEKKESAKARENKEGDEKVE